MGGKPQASPIEDLSVQDIVKIADSSSAVINPATEETLQSVADNTFNELTTINDNLPLVAKDATLQTSNSYLSDLVSKVDTVEGILNTSGVAIKNSTNSVINPSTEETLQSLVSTTGALALEVNDSLLETAYDINTAPYSATTNIASDYIFDSVTLNFSTAESKTITITSSDGTILWGGDLDTTTNNKGYNTTAQAFNLIFGQAFNANDNITVTVTQTTGACLMDLALKTKSGTNTLLGNPVLGTGNNHIGSVTISSPLESNGAIPVNIQDQHSDIINAYAVKLSGGLMSLASDLVKGSYTATMSPGHSFVNGDTFYIAENNRSFMAKVLNVATNTLTLDTPIDYAFPAVGSYVFEFINEMNVDGSSAVQTFVVTIGSVSTLSIDIYSLRLHIMDNTAMDESTFGGISALTRGLVCRKVSADGTQLVYWNAKTNGDLSSLIDNTEYSSKAPAGQYAVMFQWKIRESHGVSIRLNPGDRLELLVQDNLTSLTGMQCTVQGHVVAN